MTCLKPTLRKRILLPAILTLLILIVLIPACVFHAHKDEKQFRELTEQLFREEMLSNTLNMHYTLADPARFGITDYTPTLPCYSQETSAEDNLFLQEILAKLSVIAPSRLSAQDRDFYTLLYRSLKQSERLHSFAYFDTPLSPTSGVQADLPILLAEYTLRSKQDVADYLALLRRIKPYFASLLTYEQEKSAAGNAMPASFLAEVRRQCDTIVTKSAVKSGDHFLQTTFRERLQALVKEGILTEAEMRGALEENNRLLLESVIPAYAALKAGLEPLKDTAVPIAGLASRPGGREYYEALLPSVTGSYRSMEEIKSMLTARLSEEYEALKTLLQANPAVISVLQSGQFCALTDYTAKDILLDLQARMKGSFPTPSPNCSPYVKPVSTCLEPYCAPAFYLTVPIDDTSKGVIYINESKTPSGTDLYTTLAHEGFPGHLYQDIYHKEQTEALGLSPARELLWYGGYLEGWALYTEFMAYDYASDLLRSQGLEESAVCMQIEKHNRSLQLCLYSLLDISIHYDNASLKQASGLLGQFGITDPKVASSVYTYIVGEPCNYPKYYLGFLEIEALRETARSLWGRNYSDLRFHTFLLDNGPADFLFLQDRLQETLPAQES